MAVKLKPLSQQVIVVTGASSGIGLATVRKAARAGAAVVLTARNEQALRQICEELTAEGRRVHPVVGDVGDPEDVAKIARAAIARFGGFDTWVNDAGVGVYAELTELSHEDHERIFRTNYFGVVNGSLEAVKHFRGKPGGGALINVGSALSDIAAPLLGAYAASKHAVKGFTDSLRMEVLRDRLPVSITLIKPAGVNSPFADHAKNYMDKPPRVPPPVYAPEVVADAILYAAQHPIRDLVVGSGAKQMSLAAAAAPRLTDRLFAAVIPPLSRRPGAKPPGDNLFQPGQDGEVRSPAVRGRSFSVYTQAQMHPAVLLGVGALSAAALAAYLGRGALTSRARPMAARIVRPLIARSALHNPLAVARFMARRPRRALRIAAALR